MLVAPEADLALLGAELRRLLIGGTLVAARMVALMTVAPFFGGRTVPAPARIALGLAAAAALGPLALAPGTPLPAGVALLAVLVVKEAAIGLSMGFVAALLFHAVESAGRLADTARGLSQTEVQAPEIDTQTSPLGSLYLQLCVVVFLGLGGHRAVLLALGDSYTVLPVHALPGQAALGGLVELGLRLTAGVLVVALLCSAPVLAAGFVADVLLGLAARVNPGLPVYYVGMPLKAAAGLGLALLGLSTLAGEMSKHAPAVVSAVERVVRLLGP